MMRRRTSEKDDSSDDGSNDISEDNIVVDDDEAGTSIIKLPFMFEIVNQHRDPVQRFFFQLVQGKLLWAKCLSIFFAATLVYTYKNAATPHKHNVQIAIMTVITLVGATPLKSQIIPVSIGAFVGGHNIIGSTGDLMEYNLNSQILARNYAGLFLLSVVVGIVFQFFCEKKILDGYAGRLGSTTFAGMNIVMMTVYGPFGVVDWDRYYYGFRNVIHMAEEDSAVDLSTVWTWSGEAELAIGYVLAVIWLGWLSGLTRILHNDYIQKLQQRNEAAAMNNDGDEAVHVPTPVPPPINNVTVPCLLALVSMLIINATEYKHASGLYNGFAVGSYVGMASLGKIPTTFKFVLVSVIAALWGLLLTPVCVGFAGKSGFTSMLGHATYVMMNSALERFRLQKSSSSRLPQQQIIFEEEEGVNVMEGLHQQQQRQEEQSLMSKKVDPSDEEAPLAPLRPELNPPAKYIKPREPFLTKQQRRQQQRMKNLQQKQGPPKPVVNDSSSSSSSISNTGAAAAAAAAPKLHHRAWSAVPGDDPWKHPMEDPNQPTASTSEQHNIV